MSKSKIMDSFIRKGFYTIGALKTNCILYPSGIRQKASTFALHLRKTDPGVSLVTVGGREFYVSRNSSQICTDSSKMVPRLRKLLGWQGNFVQNLIFAHL